MKSVLHPLDSLISYFSSWWKLKRAVTWLLRFKEHLRMKSRGKTDDSANEKIQI